jgi:SAM-dependent methyltransferase
MDTSSETKRDGERQRETARESLLKFVDALDGREAVSDSPGLRRHLSVLLDSQGISPQRLVHTAVSSLKSTSQFRLWLEDAERRDVSAIREKLGCPEDVEALDDPLFHRLLRRAIVADFSIERLLTTLRHIYLEWLTRGGHEFSEAQLRIAASVACHCFNTEHIYVTGDDEQEMVEDLRKRLQEQIAAVNGNGLAIGLIGYAMYAPLWTLGASEKILRIRSRHGLQELDEILERQIREYEEEAAIRKEIRSLGMSGEPVTAEVRQQYEESPYPRWLDVTLPRPVRFAEAMEKRFPFLGKIETGEPVKILVAGCGTGSHPIQVATHYSDAEVLAMDISKASLARAIRQAPRYGLSNLEFMHGDLLCLETSELQFDAIECIGVLHTLKDPAAGFRALMHVLRPGGYMRIGVYSRRARLGLEPAKRLIESRQIGRSPVELRAIRDEIIADRQRLGSSLIENYDFFYLSGFRDLLCPAYELLFTPSELNKLLRDLKLTFLGYRNIDPELRQSYRERFPQDLEMRDLDLLDQFEEDHPEMLWSLHIFWVRKDLS